MTPATTRAAGRPLWFATLALLATALSPAAAQDYPVRPVKIIAASAPGGGFDLVARVMANQLSEQTGQQFVVENRAGAGTLIGTRAAAKAPADGYTLMVGALPNVVLNLALYKDPGYDAKQDFVPLGLAVSYSYTVIARPNFPHTTFVDMIREARANPSKLVLASGGIGSGQHVAGAIVESETGARFHWVQYKGAQAVYPDLIAGRVDLFFDNSSTARPYVESGQVKALAISSRARNPAHPDLPTITQTGVVDFEMESWFGIFGRRGTPQPIIDRLLVEVTRAAQAENVRRQFEKSGGRSFTLPAAELEGFVARELSRWTALIRKANLQIE